MPRDFDPRQAADELMATEEEATLADMLDAVESFVRRYVVLTDHQAAAVVLWIAHVFAFAAVSTTPYLWVSSATPRAGKSRLLEVLEAILGELRSVFTMNISPSALYRMVDATPGVAVLVDESDRLLKGDKERASEILGLINSGFRRRGGYAVRNVGQGANLKPVKFATFAPKVIAGIGAIADTVADRSIPIRMRRRLPSESIERFRERDVAGAAPLREALEAWVDPDTISALSVARPDLPLALNDRAADAWEVLVAIADAAGGAWPARARSAAVDLQGVTESISEEVLELLALRHVAEAFEVPAPTGSPPRPSWPASSIGTMARGRNGGARTCRMAGRRDRRADWRSCSTRSALSREPSGSAGRRPADTRGPTWRTPWPGTLRPVPGETKQSR